jgi:hypothetical protein
MTHMTEFQSSRESEIDLKLDELSGRIVRREASDADRVAYQELLAARMRLMRPRVRFKFLGAARRRLAG